jgi:hypothetical protein
MPDFPRRFLIHLRGFRVDVLVGLLEIRGEGRDPAVADGAGDDQLHAFPFAQRLRLNVR